MNRVAQIIADFPVGDLEALRLVVANKLRLKIEVIRTDADVERIADEHEGFHPALRQRLRHEFLNSTTEGLALERDDWDPRLFRYLAVIDARGERAARALFTAWHEITHLLLHPPQLAFPNFRRTPPQVEIEKDPLESAVDHVAGRLAFYPPFYGPALEEAIAAEGGLSFRALDLARETAAPTASLFAAAIGSINHVAIPILFVSVKLGLKKAEARAITSPQGAFPFAEPAANEVLRAVAVIANEAAAGSDLCIRRNMRVPEQSVLTAAYEAPSEVDLEALEDQSWWETSSTGPLPELPIRVRARRRGRFVYGLIEAAS
ncbi:MAG: hypothetical protein ACREOQ_14525 [Gemmatimonadales bacterium]